jgi:plastocyanin
MKVRIVVVLALLAGSLPGAAPAQPKPQANASTLPAGSLQATIDKFAFAPKELTVKVGSTVAWTNKDDTPHTVTSDDGVFASPVMDTEQGFQFTFHKPGRYPYHCKLHPNMTGVVVVN